VNGLHFNVTAVQNERAVFNRSTQHLQTAKASRDAFGQNRATVSKLRRRGGIAVNISDYRGLTGIQSALASFLLK
jgi:hypothetical protein